MSSLIEPLEDRTLLSAATLSPPVPVAVGADPVAVASADFNGDGLPDLVTANASGTISILLNTGNGTFAPAKTLAAGLRPTSVAVGDFNGDSKPDIAVADAATGTIKIFLNPGDGVFDLYTSYTYGTAPGVSSSPEAQLVTGDFTDDGKTDLAVADDTDNKIAVLLGNGNGTFASPVDTPFSDITDIAAANFSNSGMSDLAVIQSGADQVDTLLSSGGGTFGGKLTETLPGQPTSLAVGDFNGDGNPDLAVAMTESAHDAIDIAFGSGLGNFSSNATLTVPSAVSALAAGDFIPPATGADSTGLAAISPTGTVIIYQNNGAGTLLAAQTIASSSSAASVTSLTAAAADFTGAGTLGLAFPVSTSASSATGSGDIDVLLPQSSVVSTGLVASLSGALPISAISGSNTKLSQILTLTNNTSKTIGGKTTINLYLSPASTVLSGATPVLSFTRSVNLRPRASKSFALSLKPIPAVSAGSYYLVATATTSAGVTAIAASAKTVALGAPFINLAALSLNSPSSAKPGRRIAARLSLQNLGNIRVNRAVPMSLGISTSPTGSSPIPLAAISPRVAAAPGQKRTGTLAARLPTTLAAGSYYLVATVDPNNTLNSPTTSNNTVVSRKVTVK